MDIELTQHGKRMLSKGKLRPVYYSFFDDDIVYDSQYAGFSEHRNNAGERIRNETPSLSVQYSFSGVETDIKKIVAQKRDNIKKGIEEDIVIQGVAEKHYALSAPLGNSSQNEVNAPAWNINVLKGAITGSVEFTTGSQPNTKIPQLNMENVVYTTAPTTPSIDAAERRSDRSFGDFGDNADDTVSDLNFASARFEDESFIKIKDDFILLEVSEDNVDTLKENFDIEIFIEELDENTGNKVFSPLSFDRKKSLVVNDILVDQDESFVLENRSLDPTYVDHFFHVYVDDEISRGVLCKLVPSKTLEASFPADFLDCERFIEPRAANDTLVVDATGLYDTDVTETDLEPDC